MREKLVELKESKRKLVLLLMDGEKTTYEIKEKLGISKSWLSEISKELNDNGVIEWGTDERGYNTLRLNKNKIKTEHTRDKFIPDFTILSIAILISLFVSFFTVIEVFFGSLLVSIFMFCWFLYKVLRNPDYIKIFYMKAIENSS